MFDNTNIRFSIPVLATLHNIKFIRGGYDAKGRSRVYYEWNSLSLSISEDERCHYINGSLHKAYNLCMEGLNDNNNTDFTAGQLLKIVESMCADIGLNPFTATIHSIEFGVNVRTLIPAKDIVLNTLYMGTATRRAVEHDEIEYSLSFSTNWQHYRLKFYDKGIQQNAGNNLLRVELHIDRMIFLHNRGIHIKVLADLLHPEIHKKLGNLLMSYFDELVFSPKLFKLPVFRKGNREIIELFSNYDKLKMLRKNNMRQFKIMLNKYRELIKLTAIDNFQDKLKNSVFDKWQYISKLGANECMNLTTLLAKYPQFTMYEFNHFIILLKPYMEDVRELPTLKAKRYCQSCGKDISHQRPGSVFCSEWRLGKEGKKCKNKDSNPRNNAKRSINIRLAQPQGLFNVLATINPEILRRARMA